MTGICPKCNYLGRGKKRLFDIWWGPNTNLLFGLGVLISFIYNISFDNSEFQNSIIGLIFNILSLSIGIGLIVLHFTETKTCPKCDYDPMLSFEDAEALKKLKEKDMKSSQETSE